MKISVWYGLLILLSTQMVACGSKQAEPVETKDFIEMQPGYWVIKILNTKEVVNIQYMKSGVSRPGWYIIDFLFSCVNGKWKSPVTDSNSMPILFDRKYFPLIAPIESFDDLDLNSCTIKKKGSEAATSEPSTDKNQ